MLDGVVARTRGRADKGNNVTFPISPFHHTHRNHTLLVALAASHRRVSRSHGFSQRVTGRYRIR